MPYSITISPEGRLNEVLADFESVEIIRDTSEKYNQ
jgi:hypothetical protein